MTAQLIPRYGSRIISFISTWPAVMIYTPSNTSRSSLKDQRDIGLTACQHPDADDLSHIIQQPEESARQFWTWFLTKKNQIVDCPDAEALAAFKHNIRDEWLARHLGQEKPKSMAALTTLMTHFCAGEDSWLARSNNITKSPGNSDTKDNNGRSRRNKHKRRIYGDNTEDTTVNAGFRGSKPGQRKKPFKRNTPGPSSLHRILDRPC